MSRTPRRPRSHDRPRSRAWLRSRTWLRVLVLLLALWVPAAQAQALAAPASGVAAGTFEHDGTDGADVPDALVRPPARAVHKADVPERPAPLPGPAPARPGIRACPAAPYAAPLLRTVVLRC
ncbi:hypothetical protein [Streptomyces camelliae]|uniref:Secreted protein n=1 Tax=Streptomyces camelliae TaxID=3004093 RepID=A0ABY7P4P7_9ACTN|nr:hypothetical protein [Streptomyces sp. HUAS 2-6]WBO65280.1 hypothetical protein O1G22_21820 [Streptomyces sp. HUAS 2-6]